MTRSTDQPRADTTRSIGFSRWCFAATHVAVIDDYHNVDHSPTQPAPPEVLARYIDWDATMTIRRRLDQLGLGVAEAMDTAQRFAIGWTNAQHLIRATGELALANGFIAGTGADHVDHIEDDSTLVEAVAHQAKIIQNAGGLVIVLPLPYLSETHADAARFEAVYGAIIDAVDSPIFIHWLGEMFMPALKGYFPGDSFFNVMAHDPAKVRGAKLSLLDAEFERAARDRLGENDQVIFTGDDFNFAELIEGEQPVPAGTTRIGAYRVPTGRFSHALLGILDGIAEPAARALRHLADGDVERYRAIMQPCEELGRWIFQEPTQYYKAGLAFLAWLNGLQSNPMLLNHEERMRDRSYYRRTFELAVCADAIPDTAAATKRLDQLERYLR